MGHRSQNLTSALVARRLTRGFRRLAGAHMQRRFSQQAKVRLVIYYEPNRISYAQVFPFFYYHQQLADRFGVEIRGVPFDALLNGDGGPITDADIVILQPWFTITPADLTRVWETAQGKNPNAEISFLDSYAHNDLRLARHLPNDLKHYIKKSLFVDPAHYATPFRGDTMMMDFYADLYGVEAEAPDFQVPPDFHNKLQLSPNFLTAPHFVNAFSGPKPPPVEGRGLDMQLRLGKNGGELYSAMRHASLDAVAEIPNLRVSPAGSLDYAAYMAEMQQSKLCFSPFGYGELCWRDIEAIQTGAVMIKPDMSHLRTLPELYEPGVTYLPVAWDFSDLSDVVTAALADPLRCQTIADTAWSRAKSYLDDAKFVDDIAFLF